MKKENTQVPKGAKMEELLRGYFLKAGYYVVRGVPFIYEGFDVTDIDLWLYSRTSSVSREVTIVDAKNRKTPQAIERIFWVQGLRAACRATNAIVATTDKRPEVKDFGRELGVVVLDGSFLNKLAAAEDPTESRLSDEEFYARINQYSLSKLDGDWKGRVAISKSLLSKALSFDSCNEWLGQGKFFAEHAITKGNHRETALRCLYLICSFTAIALDYVMKEASFLDQGERNQFIRDGFTYGSRGNTGMRKVLNVAMGLVEQHAKEGPAISRQVRASVERQLEQLNTAGLGEFFSKNDVARALFAVGREFEQLAFSREFKSHNFASIELKSVLFSLIDFWNIDRVMFSTD